MCLTAKKQNEIHICSVVSVATCLDSDMAKLVLVGCGIET
jgi:hypothetical protein